MLKWILSSLLVCTFGCVNVESIYLPTRTSSLAKTSVKILNSDKDAGGSGVIYRSTTSGSDILTNKHVCGVIQAGGVVKTQELELKATSYRLYPKHDLCLVRVDENLGINLRMPSEEPAVFSDISVSGHPSLFPHIRTQGHLSEKRVISVMVDAKKCDGTEKGEDAAYCMFLGGKPVIQDFDSQLVSALIMPGSSGSGVFTPNGELTGVVFAGAGEGLSYGSIVPLKYVVDFLNNSDVYTPTIPNPDARPKSFFKMISRGRDLCVRGNPKFRKLCSRIRFQPIWFKQ